MSDYLKSTALRLQNFPKGFIISCELAQANHRQVRNPARICGTNKLEWYKEVKTMLTVLGLIFAAVGAFVAAFLMTLVAMFT